MDLTTADEFSTDSRIRELEEQNGQLKQKLEDLQHLYDNLVDDKEKINQDQRRYMQLKSKNIQLERQVQLLSSASEIRAELISEMENYALELQQTCTGDGQFSLDNHYINRWASSVLIKLTQYQIYSKQAENQSYFMRSDYTNHSNDSISIQDICRGKTQDLAYLDVSKVSLLEDKLSNLYGHLLKLHITVKDTLIPNLVSCENLVKNKTLSQIQSAMKALVEVNTELVDMSMIMPSKMNYPVKKPKLEGVDFNSEENFTKYELSLSTNQVLSRVPQFSRNRAECEKAIRSLVRAFHVQKHIWAIEREALSEEMNFFKKGYEFQAAYTKSMIQEIMECFKPYDSVSRESSYGRLFDEVIRQFLLFDNETTESNLRSLLKVLKSVATSRTSHKGEPTTDRSSSSPSLNLNTKYEKFLRDLELIQQEYRIKEEEITGKRYQYEEELLQNPMFMESLPDVLPSVCTLQHASSQGLNKTNGLNSNSTSQSKSKPPVKSKIALRSDRKPTSTSSIDSRDTKPNIPSSRSSQSNQKLNPNRILSELSCALAQKEEEISNMTNMLNNGSLSEMQRYALNKKILLEKAELKKLERSIKNLEQ